MVSAFPPPIPFRLRAPGLAELVGETTVGIFLVVVIMATVASVIRGATGGAIIGLVPGLSDDLRGALVPVTGSLTGALVLPVSYLAITLMYYDLRVRREGLDLDQLARQAQPPSAA